MFQRITRGQRDGNRTGVVREASTEERLCRLMCGGGCAPPSKQFSYWGCAPEKKGHSPEIS
jgi:hypothetical protein